MNRSIAVVLQGTRIDPETAGGGWRCSTHWIFFYCRSFD